eukprot:snap_masked-scaffold_9-processed-gene-9.26-mRNA-1 protein AED:1.00 eAED:1.00 QI:0/0/0/0/1/1/2/0/385
MLKLSKIHSFRVVLLLDLLLEKLEIIGMLPDFNELSKKRDSETARDEVVDIINQQQDYEAQFERLVKNRTQLKQDPIANAKQIKQIQGHIEIVSNSLRESTQTLVTHLSAKSESINYSKQIAQQLAESIRVVKKTIKDLNESNDFYKFNTYVLDKGRKTKEKFGLIEQQKKLYKNVKDLEDTLKKNKEEHEKQVSLFEKRCYLSKEKTMNLSVEAKEMAAYEEKCAESKTRDGARKYRIEIRELATEKENIKVLMEQEKLAREQTKNFLEKYSLDLQKRAGLMIGRLEEKEVELGKEIDKIDTEQVDVVNPELFALREMKARYDLYDIELQQRNVEAEIERIRLEELHIVQTRKAKIIQRHYKIYRARNPVKKGKKGKGKKKGKK